MTNLPPDKHQEIFQMTGIDVDNRREMMHFHVRNSERWIRGYISFAKNLPGFRDLSLNDQANLVKCKCWGYWYVCKGKGREEGMDESSQTFIALCLR